VLAIGSAIGGFVAVPHYLEPQLPLPEVRAALASAEHWVVYLSIAIAFLGLVLAAYFFGGRSERAAAVERRFAGLHRVLSGKYFVDEAYDALIGRPLQWISERVFLGWGDRMLFDGTLHGLTSLARRTAGVLGRVQTGNLQLYALMVLAGIVAALVWSIRHG